MIFILGGEGFVGSAYVRWCQKNNKAYQIINRSNYSSFIGKSCNILINANGNSSKILAKKEPLTDFDASVRSVRKSLEDFPSKKYIFLSSCDVYPDCSKPEITSEDIPINISMQSTYGFHKYLAEECVRHKHPDWLIFRMGGFVGPGLKKNAIHDILFSKKLWINPNSELQFLHTDDAAKLVLKISETYERNIFNLCGNGTVKILDIIKLTNQSVQYEDTTTMPPLHYKVDINKISNISSIPYSRDTIITFLNSKINPV